MPRTRSGVPYAAISRRGRPRTSAAGARGAAGVAKKSWTGDPPLTLACLAAPPEDRDATHLSLSERRMFDPWYRAPALLRSLSDERRHEDQHDSHYTR